MANGHERVTSIMLGDEKMTSGVNSASESESRYFDSVISDEGEFNPFLERGWDTLRRRFEVMVSPPENARLLDVGCGTGQSRQIYDRKITPSLYTGVDLSKNAIEVARVKFPDSHWTVCDACALPMESEQFDIVAFSSVLHHIPDFGRALVEAHRVLKPGGKVFAFDPNLLHPAMRLFRDPKSRFYKPEGVSPNECPLHPAKLWSAFEQAGFSAIEQRGQSDLPYRAVAPRGLNTLLTAYNAVDRLWEASGLGRRYGTFVITCGQKKR